MNYTRMLGDYVELKCMSEFVKFGYQCLIPYGCWATYDFVVDFNGTFLKIQCKESDLYYNNEEIVSFTIRCDGYTQEDIDYFATVFEDNVYLLPKEFAGGKVTLKVNDLTSDKYCEKYLFKNVISNNIEFENSKSAFLESRKEKKKYYCVDCGKEISKGSTRCADCSSKHQRVVERPTREKLKELIRNKSFREISREYNVSDKCISKWCKLEKLPYTKSEIKQISDLEWNDI